MLGEAQGCSGCRCHPPEPSARLFNLAASPSCPLGGSRARANLPGWCPAWDPTGSPGTETLLRISPLTKQTGPRNKVPIIGKAVLTASRGCLFWIPGPHGKAQDACEVLAEGGKPLATRWAHATTTTPGMQLMQNGSDFPHYGCGIALELLGAGMALELPPRLGDNQCQDEPLQRSHVLISALSLHSFAWGALSRWGSVPAVSLPGEHPHSCSVCAGSGRASGALG